MKEEKMLVRFWEAGDSLISDVEVAAPLPKLVQFGCRFFVLSDSVDEYHEHPVKLMPFSAFREPARRPT